MTHEAFIKGLDDQKTVVAAVYIPDLAFEKTVVAEDREITLGGVVHPLPLYKGQFIAEMLAASMAVARVPEGDELVIYTNNKIVINMMDSKKGEEPYKDFIRSYNDIKEAMSHKVRWMHILKGSNSMTRYVDEIAHRAMPYD